MRLALITNMPSPYRFPVWESLARRTEALQVFFCSESEPNRIWKTDGQEEFSFTRVHLPGWHAYIREMDWGLHFNPTLGRELNRFRPDQLLVSGYESPSYLLALWYAKSRGLPITLWWASHALSSRVHGGPIVQGKRWVMNQFDSFCAASTPSKEYLTREMRIPEERVACGINTVDVARWHAAAHSHARDRAPGNSPVRFLYIGQFIGRKGVLELLQAFRSLSPSQGTLRLVGYGPQETQIRNFIADQGQDNVEIAGATRTLEDTARHYAWADVLVMPSLSEVWGLVVNEALACGVYVLASKHAGATYDLIDQAPFDVGRSFDPTDGESFSGALHAALGKRAQLDRDAISSWGLRHTPQAFADGLWNSISLARRP